MPDMKMMDDYEMMLDKLASEYPELAKEASALSDKMMDMEPMDMMDEEPEEEVMMPGEESIPPELMDDEEDEFEDEEEYTL